MTRRPRRNHSPAFKAKVALAAISGEQTLVELSQQFDVHANQIKQWKDQLLEGATGVFGDEAKCRFMFETETRAFSIFNDLRETEVQCITLQMGLIDRSIDHNVFV